MLKTVATGAVQPRREVEMKSQVSGIVDKIHVEAGDEVKKGDLIARIKIIPNPENLNNAESNLRSAQIRLRDAEAEYKRNKDRSTERPTYYKQKIPVICTSLVRYIKESNKR